MEIVNFETVEQIRLTENSCRICCLESESDSNCQMTSIFQNYDSSWKYLDLYEFCVGSRLSYLDNLNVTKFCESCVESLVNYSEFKKKCQHSEEIIQQFVHESRTEKYENLEIEVETEKSLLSIETVDQDSWQIISSKIEKLDSDSNFYIIEEDHDEEPLLNTQIIKLTESEDDVEVRKTEITRTRVQENPKYTCNLCQKSYKKKSSFDMHIKKQHPDLEIEKEGTEKLQLTRGKKNKKKLLCPICGVLSLSSHIKAHTESIGNDDKSFTCEICGLKYKTQNSLTKHKRKHSNDKRYKCEYCDEKFLHWASRRNHIYLVHTGERRYQCTYCPDKFYQKGKFNIHLRRHRGELPFHCHLCPKKFLTNVALKYHGVCHSNDKPHVCMVCKKAFGRRKSLIVHGKIHTKEKNYICSICNRGFIQNHVLRTHMKSHPNAELQIPPPGTVVSQKVLQNQDKFKYPANMYFAHYNN